jgi:hypothetical protein
MPFWAPTRGRPSLAARVRARLTDADRALLADEAIPPSVPRAVRHVVTLRPADSGRTELTVQEFGYGTVEARDVSRAGLEQCLDKMVAMFRHR